MYRHAHVCDLRCGEVEGGGGAVRGHMHPHTRTERWRERERDVHTHTQTLTVEGTLAVDPLAVPPRLDEDLWCEGGGDGVLLVLVSVSVSRYRQLVLAVDVGVCALRRHRQGHMMDDRVRGLAHPKIKAQQVLDDRLNRRCGCARVCACV